ncbi:phosphoserine phosphatase serb [Annulohypoxylon maeteangense]|uniref:phosphoserine phosphatase serb n=1 Tax=Annulohypoxylon maeteangense TaxID=1927788 RepID=UPI002008CDAC|nr:phosphoserine phosphatase serb [Annulohypoxylon maeteangense]KAI0886089.1 phosphoserine phosphatase serb [Annulohypoxylon maeteangense]
MAADDSPSKQNSSRPQLSSMRTSSFLKEHQQYRPPKHLDSHFGIDTVVEDLQASRISPPKSFSPFNGVPSKDEPPRILKGANHDFTHPNCAPTRGTSSDRLVATLIYKSVSPRAPNVVPSPRFPSSNSDIPANLAPTTNIESFPLEPPVAAEPEPLDHLYGSYISPLCVTSFLHLMSTFPLPQGVEEITSSHRCLDDPEHPLVVELALSPAPSPSYLSLADLRKHELIYRFEREWNVDVALQRDTLWRRYPRLVVFDMDSTLITQEVIDLLAATITDPPDLATKVADITHRAMLGELEFDAAFRERVALLRGLPAIIFEQLRPVLDVTKGVRELLKAFKKLGIKTAVLSGGFLPLTQWLADELGIDHAHANEVIIDDSGLLTGEVQGRIVGRERKQELLLEIAKKEGISLEQVVAVGDGANDLLMLDTAGLGVAWNAKPRVQLEAGARLNGETLVDLLYLFGLTSEEVDLLTT